MKTSGKITIAAITGAAVGAVLGILFAPAKGSETREKINSKANEAKNKIAEIAITAKDSVVEKADSLKSKIKSN